MGKEFGVVVGLASSLLVTAAGAGAQSAAVPPVKGEMMIGQARGTFEVTVKPLSEDEKVPGVSVGRMSIDKKWAGDIVGTSRSEMMTTGGATKGSGGYVAVEEMKVSLKGRSGTFTLMHHATMKSNAEFKMNIVVVPDSGTGQLAGLSGYLEITIEPGKHSYRLEYTLPETR